MACRIFLLEKMKRVYPSAYPVKLIAVNLQRNIRFGPYSTRNRNAWEVALRLLSDNPESADSIGGKPLTMTFPNVLVKPANLLFRNDSCDIREFISFQYSLEVARKMIQEGLISARQLIWAVKLDDSLRRHVTEIRELLEHVSEFGVANRIDSLCYCIIQELALQREAGSRRLEHSLLASAESYMRFHLGEKISVARLAEKFGFSHRNFYRLWMEAYQISPLEWLKRRRLENAAEELTSTHRSIKEIAASSGFPDCSYFAGCFRRCYGMTPGEFRLRAMSGPEDDDSFTEGEEGSHDAESQPSHRKRKS